MIGIVVVSHSPALARAAIDLALEMVPGDKPRIEIAAGAAEGIIGTDATAVASAIDRVAGANGAGAETASAAGVLVIMDLGSAVMSAELALDFVSTEVAVRLSSAPFVEGLLAAIVTAAGGATLDEVDREAREALSPKVGMLGAREPEPEARSNAHPNGQSNGQPDGLTATLTIVNADGLHARPAASLVGALSGFDAKVTFENQRSPGRQVAGNSLIGLLSLGGETGDVLTVSASGTEAARALAKVETMFEAGFGELSG